MAQKDPAFPWYARDWLSSWRRRRLDLEQQAAYFNLLNWAWLAEPRCYLPNDPEQLAGMAEWIKPMDQRWDTIIAMFEVDPEKGLYSERMMRCHKERLEYSKSQSEHGIRGNKKRWGSGEDQGFIGGRSGGDHKGIGSRRSSSSSSLASSSSEEKSKDPPLAPPRGDGLAAELTELWNSQAPLPKIKTMSPKRRKSLNARNTDAFWRDNWREALRKVPTIPGLVGENERGWVANVEWFLRPDTVTHIIEGKYDQWGKSKRLDILALVRQQKGKEGA